MVHIHTLVLNMRILNQHTGKLGTQYQWLPGDSVIRKPILRDLQLITISQFFITTASCDFLDGKHVVFGKVIDGMLTLRKIENVSTGPNNRPKLAVKIVGE